MFKNLKKKIIVTGHYGCGKTNFSVNLALYYQELGEETEIADLDIVNPYFRAADHTKMLAEHGVTAVMPQFANTLLDIPAVPKEVSYALFSDKRTIIDLGGDDAGATVMGRYRNDIEKIGGVDMLYLFSSFRPLTEKPSQVAEHIAEIEAASRQKVTWLVNSSNLGSITSKENIEASIDFANEASRISGIPLLANLVMEGIDTQVKSVFRVKRFVKLPWE